MRLFKDGRGPLRRVRWVRVVVVTATLGTLVSWARRDAAAEAAATLEARANVSIPANFLLLVK